VRLRLFRAHRRLRENLQDATHTKARRLNYEANRTRANRERAERQREEFVPLGAATGFACGD